MSIDRTNFNALVDDDGSNTVGTLFVKNTIKTVLLDPIDAALSTVQTTTLTGAQADFALSAGCTELRCNNASLLTLSGFAAGTDGQRVQLISVGAGQVDIANQNAGSVAANRVINTCTATLSLAAGSGTLTIQYDTTTARWRVVSHNQGAWITRAFAAGNFVGSGAMTWTVAAAATDAYLLSGRTLTYSFDISGTIGGTPNTLISITLPAGVTVAKVQLFPGVISNAGTQAAGYSYVLGSSGTLLNLQPSMTGATNWTAGANIVYGTVTVEIN